MRLRLATKPSQLPAKALTLPMSRPSFIAAAIVAGEVFVPSTTSNSFMTLAGAKKCVPATASGRLVAPAILSMSIAEVLVSSSAPGFITASSFGEHLLLHVACCSNTASITRRSRRSPRSVSTGSISARRLSISACVRLPRLTLTA